MRNTVASTMKEDWSLPALIIQSSTQISRANNSTVISKSPKQEKVETEPMTHAVS